MSTPGIDHQDTEDNVEYVELLDVPVYADSGQEILDTAESADQHHEIIQDQHIEHGDDGVMDDPEEQEVEYIEAEEIPYDSDLTQLPTGHTIFMHDGKQYMVPNSLHQNGQTLVFQEESEEDTAEPSTESVEYEPAEDDDYVLESVNDVEHEELAESAEEDVPVQLDQDGECYLMYGDDADEQEEQDVGAVPLGRQYAVLKNGKLHITTGQTSADGTDDMQEKLQALEDTLNYVDVDMDAMSPVEHSEEDLTNDEHVEEITGRNLITGQTISLSGFLEKIKRKVDDPLYENVGGPRAKRRRKAEATSAPHRPEYVLVPPVNKRVVVGKTADVAPEVEETRHIEELIIDNTGKILNVDETTSSTTGRNVVVKKKIVTRAYLDQNIVRTLSGLMELETIERHLAHKNLIVKHVLKKSIEGVVLTGKQVTYYYGYMQRTETIDCYNNEPRPSWTFVSNHLQEEETDDGEQQQQSINLSEDAHHDSQQVNVSVNADGKITFIGDGNSDRVSIKQEPCVYDETVTVNLIVTQDEHGRKRTKVIIPQLATNVSAIKCATCGRAFKSEQHLRRHVNQHHTSTSSADMSATSSSTAGGARYTCDLCNRTFSDMETLFRHSRTHGSGTEELPSASTPAGGSSRFTCNICNKSFNTTGSLRRHMTVHYPSLRPLQCMTCLQRFTDESSLKKHMLLHTGIRPYQCEVCARTFVHQGDLNFHRKIHDLVKRYRCDVCGKEFNRHSNMVRHAEIHRPQGGALTAGAAGSEGTGPPYTCDTCGCQYNFVSSLTRHIVNNHMNGTALGGSYSSTAPDQHRSAVDSITSHNDEHSS
ncbi:uncharacterized protein CBL_02102 [Carabus blaptoides fortunei]